MQQRLVRSVNRICVCVCAFAVASHVPGPGAARRRGAVGEDPPKATF